MTTDIAQLIGKIDHYTQLEMQRRTEDNGCRAYPLRVSLAAPGIVSVHAYQVGDEVLAGIEANLESRAEMERVIQEIAQTGARTGNFGGMFDTYQIRGIPGAIYLAITEPVIARKTAGMPFISAIDRTLNPQYR